MIQIRKNMPYLKKVHMDIFQMYMTSLCILVSFALLIMYYQAQHMQINTSLDGPSIKKDQPLVFDKRVFEGITIEGKSYIVYDVVTKQIIASHNEQERLPLASITKVMAALTALSLSDTKEIIIEVGDSDIEGRYDLGLERGQKWKLEELLKYMLIFSSNDATLAIARYYGGNEVFVSHMNQLAASYGLGASFNDPAGRDVATTLGGQGTALDVALLFAAALKDAPDIMDATTKKRQSVYPLSGRLTGVPNTNQYIDALPGVEASKTGFTDLAGGNLGVVVDITIGRPVVLVVLGSTKEGRFRDIQLLYKALEKSIASFPTSSE